MTTKPTRPIVRYHGGKWRLAEWITSHFPEHRCYVEPFGGGGSVLLRKPRAYAEVYNDLDGEIVNVFRVLQDPDTARELERLVRLTPFARAEFELSYEPTTDPIETARRTIMRSFMGFGSDGINDARLTGFRANSNRSGTTPAHDWMHYPEQIGVFCWRLAGVVIEQRNYADVIAQHDSPETLIYADPPYLHATRTDKKRYRCEFSDDDHIRLAEVLNNTRGMVIVSGYPSDFYTDLYAGWHYVTRAAQADGARPRTEALWISPNIILHQEALL